MPSASHPQQEPGLPLTLPGDMAWPSQVPSTKGRRQSSRSCVSQQLHLCKQQLEKERCRKGVSGHPHHPSRAHLGLVQLLLPVGDFVPNDGPDVLDDHGVLLNVSSSIKAQALEGSRGHTVL